MRKIEKRLANCASLLILIVLLTMPMFTQVHSWSTKEVQFSTADFDPDMTYGLKATGPVAVLEDTNPWGYNSVEEILDDHVPMIIDVIPSSSFGAVDLSVYQKVIISSVQSAAFYTALDANKTWIESYVVQGGVLEVNAATFGSFGDWILPFGFGFVSNNTNNVEVADPTHHVLNYPFWINVTDLDDWNWASHGYFNNTEDATIILTDGAGEPVLFEQRFGCGYIIATCQPVEYAHGFHGYTDFLENLVWYVPTAYTTPDGAVTGPLVVLQDYDPWYFYGVNATQEILVKYGIGYDIFNSSYFGTFDLSGYQKVIISASQDASFYTLLESNRTWLENYVDNGGILEVHAATQGGDLVLPGNLIFNYSLADTLAVNEPYDTTLYSPYWIRVPELNNWFYATHGYFTNTMDSRIILTDGAEPVFIEKALGEGFILASGQPLEYAWHNNYSYFLENLILYMPGAESPALDPQNDRFIEFGTTGHSLTWNPIDCRFVAFNVTRNGALIQENNWTVAGITADLDGFAVGTYDFILTMWDVFNKSIQDTVLVTVEDTIGPTFDEAVVDQTIGSGADFIYNLNASDLSGVDHWWISDTDSFSISDTGVITNAVPLQAGVYELEVRAYDPYDNYGTATFSLTVVSPFPLEIAAIVGAAALGIVIIALILLRLRKSGESK